MKPFNLDINFRKMENICLLLLILFTLFPLITNNTNIVSGDISPPTIQISRPLSAVNIGVPELEILVYIIPSQGDYIIDGTTQATLTDLSDIPVFPPLLLTKDTSDDKRFTGEIDVSEIPRGAYKLIVSTQSHFGGLASKSVSFNIELYHKVYLPESSIKYVKSNIIVSPSEFQTIATTVSANATIYHNTLTQNQAAEITLAENYIDAQNYRIFRGNVIEVPTTITNDSRTSEWFFLSGYQETDIMFFDIDKPRLSDNPIKEIPAITLGADQSIHYDETIRITTKHDFTMVTFRRVLLTQIIDGIEWKIFRVANATQYPVEHETIDFKIVTTGITSGYYEFVLPEVNEKDTYIYVIVGIVTEVEPMNWNFIPIGLVGGVVGLIGSLIFFGVKTNNMREAYAMEEEIKQYEKRGYFISAGIAAGAFVVLAVISYFAF